MFVARLVLRRLHLAHRHLAVALVRIDRCFLELVPDAAYANHIGVEVQPLQLGGIVRRHVLRVAGVQSQLEITHAVCHSHVAAVGIDGMTSRRVRHVIDRHLAHQIRSFVDVAGAQVDPAGTHLVDHLLAQSERRLLLCDVDIFDGTKPVLVDRNPLSRLKCRGDVGPPLLVRQGALAANRQRGPDYLGTGYWPVAWLRAWTGSWRTVSRRRRTRSWPHGPWS